MTARRYRYQRTDFSPLPVALEHVDVTLDFRDDRVHGAIVLHMTVRVPLDTLTLDARDLTMGAVE